MLLFICHNIAPHEQGRISKLALPTVLKLALGKGDGFIVHAQSDGRLLHQYLPEAKYVVTPIPTYADLGIADTSDIEIPVTLPDDRPILLFCGIVRPYKGLDVLLDALAICLRERPLHLLVAGEFWAGGEPEYRQQIDRLGINEHVTILNEYLPDELLAACIDRADVVVLPYRSATQSAIIQTAFGRGKPVITTDVGGLGEVVENGRTGLVVRPEDPAELADSILNYLNKNLQEIFMQNLELKKDIFCWAHLLDNLAFLTSPNNQSQLL
jgi:glycosyltransferase involved in cell wall biosynthesis